MRATTALVMGLGLAALAGAEGTEQDLFMRAEKVVLGRVLRLEDREPAAFSSRAKPYENQVWWVRDEQVFKGPPHSVNRGYQVVYAPVWVHRNSPRGAFMNAPTVSDIPPDQDVLLYLERDPDGAWRLLDGKDGFFRYPGSTRMSLLSKWAKAAPAKRSP